MISYEIKPEQKKEMAAILLLYKMYKEKKRYSIFLNGDDKYLEPFFEYLLAKDNIIIDNEDYAINEKGRQTYKIFMKRYTDFIISFDVYSAVDLEEGEFAFEKYFQIEDENSWENYLEEDRFEDLRIAVAIYKGIEPAEMVFLSFLHDGKFSDSTSANGWQFDLASGKIWVEINSILHSALKLEDLSYQDGAEEVSGEEVIKDIIKQGAKLNQVLWQEEGEYLKDEYPDIIEIEDGVYESYILNEKHKDKIWTRKYF